jgi:hypothetical protein
MKWMFQRRTVHRALALVCWLFLLGLTAFLAAGVIGCLGENGPRATTATGKDRPMRFDGSSKVNPDGLLEVDEEEEVKMVMPPRSLEVLQATGTPQTQDFHPK